MKHYFTSKLLLLVAVLLGWTTMLNGQNYQEVRKWDFTTWSETTITNLLADATNWEAVYKTDGETIERFKNNVTISATQSLKANGVEIAETSDMLFFAALTKGNLSLRINQGDDGIQLGKDGPITLKNLKAGQKVVLNVKSANNTSPRGIKSVTNLSGTVGSATYKTGEQGIITYDLTVIADGNCTFTNEGGILVKDITVSEESEEITLAFIYTSDYSGYTIENDPVNAHLKTLYNVTDIDVKSLDGSTVEDLLDYTLVFSSEAVGGTHKFGLALKNIVNKVPMLNLKSFYYTSGRWSWATPKNPSPITNKMIIEEAYRTHELFNGVTIGEDGSCVIFTELGAVNQVQAYTAPDELIAGDIIIAKDGNGEFYTIHEHGTVNKYMLIPMASNLIAGIDPNALKLIENAVNYLAATKYVVTEQVVTPVISSVVNDADVTVSISCETEGATIYYSIDGSEPTVSSDKYENPFNIIKSCTVKAIALKEGMLESELATQEIINPNYVPRNKTLLWANFKDQPEEWGVTGDIFKSGASGEKEYAGFKVGSGGQRVNLQTTGTTENPEENYGPATLADLGASSYGLSFLAGGSSGYFNTTQPIQGPFDVTLWWCRANTASTEKVTISVKKVDDEQWQEIGTLSTNIARRYVRQSVSYEGKDEVLVKVAAAAGNNTMIFDMKLFGEGEDIKEKAKVAYVYKPDYSAKWNVENDQIYAALSEAYEVTDININEADPAKVEELAQYDLVIASEAIGGTHAYGLALKEIVNMVPMLNMKSFFYNSGRWDWGTGVNPTDRATVGGAISVTVQEDYKNHALFDGVTIGEDGSCQIFTEVVMNENQLQAYTAGAFIENDPVLAKIGDYDAIHTHGSSDNLYMLIPISSDVMNGRISDNGITLIMNAAEYLLASKKPVDQKQTAATPVISSVQNEKTVTVTITTETEGGTIYYTTDGADPKVSNGLVYAEPFEISRSCTVKAITVKEGMYNSEIASQLIENANYIARNKVLLESDFKDKPDSWGASGDIVMSGATYEEKRAGFTVGSMGQRVNLQETGITTEIGGTYGPATEEDAEISSWALSFLTGDANAYLITPRAIEGPFDVALWWCMAKNASLTEKIQVSVKTESAEEWTEIGILANNYFKQIKKQIVSYNETEAVYVKLTSISENGSNNNAMMFNLRIYGEGEDPVERPTVKVEDSTTNPGCKIVTLATTTEGASIYYTLDGSTPSADNGVLYEGPFEVCDSCTLKAIAVKTGKADSTVRTYGIVAEGNNVAGESIQKAISSQVYYTVGGVELSEPVEGVNLVKTSYEDGTVEMSKIIVVK